MAVADRTDAQLIADHLAGDRNALSFLLQRYRDLIGRICVRYRADLDDVMQECALKVLTWVAEFDGSIGMFSHWVTKVARSTAVTHARWHSIRNRPGNEWEPSYCEEFQRPDMLVERAQSRWMLGRAMKRLRPEPAIVLHLRYWNGADMDTVAKNIGKPPGTVRGKLSYALNCLYRDMGFEGARPRVRTFEIGHGAKRCKESADG